MATIVTANCPKCKNGLRIPKEWLGQAMRCKHCQSVFQANVKDRHATPLPPTKVQTSPTKGNASAPIPAKPIQIPQATPAKISAPVPATAPAPVTSIRSSDLFAFDDVEPTPSTAAPRSKYKPQNRKGKWRGVLIGMSLVALATAGLIYFGGDLLSQIQGISEPEEPRNKVIALNGEKENKAPEKAAPLEVEGKVTGPKDGDQPKNNPTPGTSGKKKGNNVKPGNRLFPRRALAISVNDYLLANSLNYGYSREAGFPGSSSRAVLEAFGNFYMKFPNTQLVELSDYSRDGDAPLKEVIKQTIVDFLNMSRKQDRIVVLFSGHAVEINDIPYLVPIEGDLEDPETLIPLDWVYKQLEQCPARQKVFIIDVCRFDPSRGRERPGSEPMTKGLDDKLQNPPQGVQVWSSCIFEQQSYEFEKGSLFLESLCKAMWERLDGFQEPEDPLPLDQLFPRVNANLKDRLKSLKMTQVSRLVGTAPDSGASYDPAQPLPGKQVIKLPELPGGSAGKALVKGILDEINSAPPPRVGRPGGVEGLRYAALPPFSSKILADYKTDDYNEEKEFLDKDKEFPLRAAVVKAKKALKENAKTFAMREAFSGQNTGKVKESILKEQERPGKAIFYLEEALEGLLAAEEHREKEQSKRWKAHYDYVVARLKSRLIYLLEYSYILGQIRRDDLPELGDGSGFRLASKERPSTNEGQVRQWRRELRSHWRDIIDEYPGTPWSLMARRERLTNLGLEWRVSRD